MFLCYLCRKITAMTAKYKNIDNDPDVVNDDPGAYQYQQPLTFEKVWKMFQETKQMMRELSKEADRRFKETERIVRNNSKIIGGIGNNIGEAAEEYFRAALEKKKELAGIKIEHVNHLSRKGKNFEGEYDAVLFGKDTLIVVEVKHKLTREDVLWFINKSLPTFKPLFPEYSDYKVLGAVAAMSAQKTAVKLAMKRGLLVVAQAGQQISLLNPGDFKPQEF